MPIHPRNVYGIHPAGPALRKLPLGRKVLRSELETRVMTGGKPDAAAHMHLSSFFTSEREIETQEADKARIVYHPRNAWSLPSYSNTSDKKATCLSTPK